MSIHHSPRSLTFIDDELLFRASENREGVEIRITDALAPGNQGVLIMEEREVRHLHSWLGDLIKRYDNHGRQDA